MLYQHEVLISKHAVDLTALPDELRKAIESFDELEVDLEEAEGEADEAKLLREELKQLDVKLVSQLEEWLDDETGEPKSEIEIKLEVLERLFKEGRERISEKVLKAEGYPVKTIPKESFDWVDRIAPFVLVRQRFETEFTIYKK